MSDAIDIKKGLAGVYADTTKISKVMEETNSLTYRGYPVQELAALCKFEEVAYLIWHGELPMREQLMHFERQEREHRWIGDDLIEVMRKFRKTAHPMDTLRTAVSFLGVQDPETEDNSPKANLEKSIKMMARIPTIVAADYRLRNGKEPIKPDPKLGFAENFFHMCFGEVPAPEVVKCFDVSLTLYAEHSFNASTFTSRVIASTTSDIYSAVVGGIGALKGPLHGGANEAVMHMMLEVDDPKKAEAWLLGNIADKRLVMGFGHRVYKHGDSRVPTMKKAFLEMAKIKNGQKWVEMYEILERTMLAKKNIHPNLDFPTGPAYYLMGFDIPMFTPIFVMSRITGWTAHVMEQNEDNKLIRPLAAYDGSAQRKVLPVAER
ncbi:bifunctional 2-methylcitrate synthase/citrate synthase [Roseiterribacter gracilis]|uniref:Citrate synthase n=1 Tax=Roseiterribacter gracilis TaxID=2812848 RepID=A0A8S8XEG2_9PROT|nr:citrate synthase [Rhodospirillales bacterium TMPK1]